MKFAHISPYTEENESVIRACILPFDGKIQKRMISENKVLVVFKQAESFPEFSIPGFKVEQVPEDIAGDEIWSTPSDNSVDKPTDSNGPDLIGKELNEPKPSEAKEVLKQEPVKPNVSAATPVPTIAENIKPSVRCRGKSPTSATERVPVNPSDPFYYITSPNVLVPMFCVFLMVYCIVAML